MRFAGVVEEIGSENFDGEILNKVVLPLMANSRIAKNGKVDPNEIHKREIFVTTACSQQLYGYQKLQEVYTDMVNNGSAFVIGNSYELPCMFNQLDIDYVMGLKESPTYSIFDKIMSPILVII